MPVPYSAASDAHDEHRRRVDTSDEACAMACMLVSNPQGSLRCDGDGWQKRVNDLIRALRDERNALRDTIDLRQLLARTVMAAGGEVTIPLYAPPCRLTRQDRATPDVIVLTASEQETTESHDRGAGQCVFEAYGGARCTDFCVNPRDCTALPERSD
jgi:hypothetical protein